jgi:class 3 adenylate cyclase
MIEENDGVLLKTEGDSFLVIFRKPANALKASIEMQRALEAYNRDKADEDKVLLCLGMGWGRVLKIGDDDVFGAEVNAASKLGEDTAKAGEILVTGDFLAALELPAGCRAEEIPDAPPGSAKAYKVYY